MGSHNVRSAPPSGAIDRLERAATLLLAVSALAAVALIGWGGLVLDLTPLGAILVALVRAANGGQPVQPTIGDAIVGLNWEDLAPLAGTVVTLLFWWHAVSLAAEVMLLLAVSLGWLWHRSLRPTWLVLDVLDSAPLAAPKRLVVATVLASQMLVRSAGPGLAASQPAQAPAAVVVDESAQPQTGPARPVEDAPPTPEAAPTGIVHRVQPGDTCSGISLQVYGHAGYWPVVFDANRGAIMTQPAFGLGNPIRLTNPDYLLPGWDALVPLLPGHLELGDHGELLYVVQRGDTVSGIAQRFGVSVDDLVAANTGAQTPDGRVFEDPNLIWPGLRLEVRPAEPASGPPEQTPAEPDVVPAPATTPEEPRVPVTPSPSPMPVTVVLTEQPAASSVQVTQAVPTIMPTAETPARPRVDEPPLFQWPELLGAGGLGAAALLALRARRARRRSVEPENDTQIDVHAFTLAAPAAVVAARHGGADDPHGVILGERVTGALLRHTRAAGIDSARTVSVKVGRTGCTVTFEAPLEQRPRLEAILRTASHVARRLRVTRSADQDVVVELEGIQRDVLERVGLEECPLLLCIGLQPDTRAYLAGWDALGHLLVATQAGTSDAHEHLASLVATLAGQCPPTELQLYTLASGDTLLGQLGPLPHQRAVVDPTGRTEATQLLATLRTELERRRQRQILDPQVPQLVLVVSELAQVAGEEDLRFLLTHGSEFQVRVVAATADTALERDLLVDGFESRLVFALEDEVASTRLLGKPWALTLAEPGRLLARLGQRKEVEILGLHLTEDGRRDLLASMELGETAPPAGTATRNHEAAGEHEQLDDKESQGEPAAPAPAVAAEDGHGGNEAPSQNGEAAAAEERQIGGAQEVSSTPVASPGARTNGHAPSDSASASEPTASEPPERIARLLKRGGLVIDCESAVVWSRGGPLQLGQSSPIEVLFRLAAAPLLEQGPLDRWPGVKAEELLEEVWAPRARVRNRESSQTWLGKNLERLQDDVRRAVGVLDSELLVRGAGTLRVNPDVAISDVEAFMEAVERARAARGAERIAAAEEALMLSVPELLPGAYVERT
ncbi:MAG: LysM peptidoglycan-binding domain-containing protein, partial [Chloroflexota bacterium]|nr:LysM peptidoglycan-binding domain-containing protein [Chloroflexota bacterium]